MKYGKDDVLLTKDGMIVVVYEEWNGIYFCTRKDDNATLGVAEENIITKVKYSDTIESLRISHPEYFV